eukprot:gene41675-4238_t
MSRQIMQVFEEYQRARVKFHIEALQSAGVMALLRPLLLDNVESIQQSAALALGRLASYNDELAEQVVQQEILQQLVYSLSEQNRYYKKSAAFVLRAVAKHSPQLAQAVVDAQAVEQLVNCLEEFDPCVKESAAWALGYIARHNSDLAQAVVDSGATHYLVLCVQEPELALKRIAASTLSDIAKHTPELAQVVVDNQAINHLAPLVTNSDAKLKRQVCQCLAQIAKHSVELAELVVEGEIFPKIFNLLKDIDDVVRKNAATCHTPELAQLIVNAGGVGALVDYVHDTTGNARLPGIMTLGAQPHLGVAARRRCVALPVRAAVPAQGGGEVRMTWRHRGLPWATDHVRAAAAWSLGQIGRHTPGPTPPTTRGARGGGVWSEHAKSVADCGVLPKLLDVCPITPL